MAPHAHKQPLSFDPVIDTPEYRQLMRAHYRKVVDEYVAEHGPLDQAKISEIQAKLEADDAKLAELHDEA